MDFYQYENTVIQVSKCIQVSVESYRDRLEGLSFPVATPDPPDDLDGPKLNVADIVEVSDGLSTDQAYKITKHVTNGDSLCMADPSIIGGKHRNT